jgi:hypothetical protein
MNSYRLVSSVFVFALAAFIPGTQKSFAAPAPEPGAFGQERWEMPPGEFNEIQRRGFHDGIEGARRDYGNHRQPNVNNREEYRNNNMPRDVRHAYKEAFRRGYEMAASRLWSGGPPPPPVAVVPAPGQDWDRWGMRGLRNDAERRGYRDGVEEARHDVQFNRDTDPDDQPQFRNPPVPPPMAGEYREGFLRGYEVGVSQLRGEQSWEGRGDPGQWVAPREFSEWQRRGFRDGVDGAQKDYGNHRRPSVLNRWEYNNPRVPPEFARDYRRGFRRGYEMAASRLWGGM